ncbi:MAG TPA: PIN domain-containing protein [Candidatus Angelobacter sp.]|jgi:hypothetical protein|nr:PIN domain-containing protein [Candidatus Angelobacter sp.]
MTIKVVAFPDTNLFLHYRPLNEIDWRGLLAAQAVELKIAPIVPRELEQQKIVNSSRKLRERADNAIRLLHAHLDQPNVRDGVTVELLANEPNAETAVAYDLNLQIADDRLIGSLLRFRELNPALKCVLVTSDLPLKVKAKQHSIMVFTPDKSLQLPSEDAPMEKKVKQLEAELRRYQAMEPKLQLVFENQEPHARFVLPAVSLSQQELEAEVMEEFENVKREHSPVEIKSPAEVKRKPSGGTNPFTEVVGQMSDLTKPFEDAIREHYKDYNRRLDLFYAQFRAYTRATLRLKTLGSRAILIGLKLTNKGSCPGEDIHVSLHFPDGFELYDAEHPPEMPKRPEPPSKEFKPFGDLARFELPILPDYSHLTNPRPPAGPKIRKTNSYDVTFERKKLNHGFTWTLDPLLAIFESREAASSFSIDYTIHAANLRKVVEGQLNVIIEKK